MKSDRMLVRFVRIDPGNTIRCSPLAWYDLQTCAEGRECRRSTSERCWLAGMFRGMIYTFGAASRPWGAE